MSALLDSLLELNIAGLGGAMTLDKRAADLWPECEEEVEILSAAFPQASIEFAATGDYGPCSIIQSSPAPENWHRQRSRVSERAPSETRGSSESNCCGTITGRGRAGGGGLEHRYASIKSKPPALISASVVAKPAAESTPSLS
jgi:hypothetical protein